MKLLRPRYIWYTREVPVYQDKSKPALAVFACLALSLSGAPASTEAEDSGNPEMLYKYLDASQIQQAVLRSMRMEIDIDAKLPKLSKQGTLRALRSISRLGQITFKTLGFYGDDTVKKEVIA